MSIPRIQTKRAYLTVLHPDQVSLVVDYINKNKEHLAPWDPLRSPEYFALESCAERLASEWKAFQEERGLCLYAFKRDESEIIGRISFTNIVRGPFQACHLGYSIGSKVQGQGLMTELLEAAIDHVFTELKLHRIMANYLPRNKASARVLEKLGFEIEGKARAYLKIAGNWEDHILSSKINPQD